MKLRFRKPTVDQLDLISSVLGAVAGIAQLCAARKYISLEDAEFVGGLALIGWGFFCNKPPRISNKQQRLLHPDLLLNELRE
ncbi:hypothetical protein QUB75_04760 [Microcoleus sp. K1-B6]|uniref:hypothetical protein n=1 Tax=unclassified Microcoleus TaxID=2642155 RepID=UPI002FCE99FB